VSSGRLPVELDVVDDPAGRRAVLVQFGDSGWVTLLPDSARELAENLTLMAEQIDAGA
jgi:hypothetical protein